MSQKLPSFQFYPGDWMKDPALRAVSVSARGLWIDMLCLMFESDRRGHLIHTTGHPITPGQLARMAGCSCDEIAGILQELETCGVFSRTKDGIIFSRRLERDERKRVLCSEAGKRGGGNPTFIGQSKGGHKGNNKGDHKQNANPSSSSSSSFNTPPTPSRGSKESFEKFWGAYPRKKSKGQAEKAWDKLKPSEQLQNAILKSLELAKTSAEWTKDNGQFIPHPATWLNARGWEDEYEQVVALRPKEKPIGCNRCRHAGRIVIDRKTYRCTCPLGETFRSFPVLTELKEVV